MSKHKEVDISMFVPQELKHTKKTACRSSHKPAGSKSHLKPMGFAMMLVFAKHELVYPRGRGRQEYYGL